MIDFNKPVQTRDGRKVEIVSTRGREDYPVIGYIGGSPTLEKWTRGGLYLGPTAEQPEDLINVPEKVRGWVMVYPDKTVGCVWPSRHDAEVAARGSPLTLRLVYVEETDPPEEGK